MAYRGQRELLQAIGLLGKPTPNPGLPKDAKGKSIVLTPRIFDTEFDIPEGQRVIRAKVQNG